ncbi:hypothetical protein TNCV_678721 [Trichonephila clavipes]|nr:hypothetical protein TNCV_678721 [Trichonephila clavipes]
MIDRYCKNQTIVFEFKLSEFQGKYASFAGGKLKTGSTFVDPQMIVSWVQLPPQPISLESEDPRHLPNRLFKPRKISHSRSQKYLIGERGGSKPSILRLGPNSIGHLR